MSNKDFQMLREELKKIKEMGWIKNRRPGNAGGVGNTLEDLLNVPENNLQLPDFGKWELKSQRSATSSLLTLFHMEPKPAKARVVPRILLPLYGWGHQKAGILYPENERSFRQTINAISCSDRGFKVEINREQEKVSISFDFGKIDIRHSEWKNSILNLAGTGDISPKPYWTFSDIQKKLDKKLHNLMYVKADTKTVNGEEYFKYNQIEAFANPSLEKFLSLMESGFIYIDFDARTGHNHGTKFRIKPAYKEAVYNEHIKV